MSDYNPFAPIRPDQEQAIAALLATGGRLRRERILRDVPGLSVEGADRLLAILRGETPTAPAFVPAPPPQCRRAEINELTGRLDAHFATRAMQPVGLHKPSHFAGLGGNPPGMRR